MTPIPRFQPFSGPAIFSAGFRPFFLGGALWAALGIPLWILVYTGSIALKTSLPPLVWHVHEMVYGYGGAVVAGFLLTAIPNWTGRLPLQGIPLIALVSAWALGRAAVAFSSVIGAVLAVVLDLAFPVAFLLVVAREIVVGRSWHNTAVVGALFAILAGNVMVHLQATAVMETADLGNRLGIAMLLALISLIGGRIVPSFTTNWLRKNEPGARLPAPHSFLDVVALVITVASLALWVSIPSSSMTSWATVAGGLAAALRLARWRGLATTKDPLLTVLHIGYAWLAAGLILLGVNQRYQLLPDTAALHALTVGAIGTMTLAVMTRATLGHTGQALHAGAATVAIYVLVNLAAVLRTLAPLASEDNSVVIEVAGIAWTAAFLLFAVAYRRLLLRPRAVP